MEYLKQTLVNSMVFKYIFVLFILITIMLTGVVLHEQAHKQIYIEAGCDNITINYNLLESSITHADCNISNEMQIALFQAQANVESNYEFIRFDLYVTLLILVIIFN